MPGPKSIRKRSAFAAFSGSTEGLIVVELVMRRALNGLKKAALAGDADAFNRFREVSKDYVGVVSQCRDQLLGDLKARAAYEDLRERLESGMSNDEVQATLEYHFENLGWGSLADARSRLRAYLIDVHGLDPESADTIAREGLPKRTARSRTLPVTYKMRRAYKAMEAELEGAAGDLEEALASSEDVLSGADGAQATDDQRPLSEEE